MSESLLHSKRLVEGLIIVRKIFREKTEHSRREKLYYWLNTLEGRGRRCYPLQTIAEIVAEEKAHNG
jgi:hypothetical protein